MEGWKGERMKAFIDMRVAWHENMDARMYTAAQNTQTRPYSEDRKYSAHEIQRKTYTFVSRLVLHDSRDGLVWDANAEYTYINKTPPTARLYR